MRCPALLLGGFLALVGSSAAANDLVVTQAYSPIVAPAYVAPTVVAPTTVYYPPAPPIVEAPVMAPPAIAPVTTYSPVVVPRRWITYSPVVPAAPAPVVTYSPVVPVAPAPVVTYSPVVTAPAPVVTFSPVVPAAPVVAAPAIGVRSKVVYVPGQPVRNFFRTITP
jgi:hypothetical protein